MGAQFHIKSIHNLGGLLALKGEVKKGKIREGDSGTTWENKRFKLTRIQSEVGSLSIASTNNTVTLVVRNITRFDVTPGDVVFIE